MEQLLFFLSQLVSIHDTRCIPVIIVGSRNGTNRTFYFGSFHFQAEVSEAAVVGEGAWSWASRGTWSTAHLSRPRHRNVCPINKHLFSRGFYSLLLSFKNAQELSAGKHADVDQNRKMKQCSLVRELNRYLFPPENLSVILISRNH